MYLFELELSSFMDICLGVGLLDLMVTLFLVSFLFLPFFFFFFAFFRAAPEAYGGSQARGPIGAIAAGLHHSHSNTRSQPHL